MPGNDLLQERLMWTNDARWRAVLERDPRAEGRFVYAVTTTGIFCRPTCPSRRPKREHVTFYAAPAEAQAAGYRGCRRCEPSEVPREQRWVAAVQERIETAEKTPTLTELGAMLGVSPPHLQRVFKRATGMSPKQYANALKAERLRAGLRDAETVAAAQYDAGFGSARASYEVATAQLGMTPGRFKRGGAGETIRYAHADSPLGRFLVATTDRGVCALRFGADEDAFKELQREFPAAELSRDDAGLSELVSTVSGHISTLEDTLTLALDVAASAFQRKVWSALRDIPPGERRTYGEVAEAIGRPSAVRAVARACATNPVALAIPCHRVIRADGALAGYRWGAERKRRLLAAEAEVAASD